MKFFVFLLLGLVVLAGCVTAASRQSRYEQKLEAWMEAHPDQEITPAIRTALQAEAEKELQAEAAQARQEAIAAAAKTAGSLATGDFVGAGAGLLALLGIGVGAYKKAKGTV